MTGGETRNSFIPCQTRVKGKNTGLTPFYTLMVSECKHENMWRNFSKAGRRYLLSFPCAWWVALFEWREVCL